MTEKEANETIRKNEQAALDVSCEALRNYTRTVQKSIANLVASLCDVDVDEMLNEPRIAPLVQARWLYWYASKQLCGETNESISQRSRENHYFKTNGITKGISKMSMLIQDGTIWTKRWAILKRVIMEANKVEQPELFAQNITVKITHPRGVNIELKQE
jgi:hypothetical protein